QVTCLNMSAGHQNRPASITAPASASRTTAEDPPRRNPITTSATIAHWWTLRAVTSNIGSSSPGSLTLRATYGSASLFHLRGEPRVDHHLAHPARVQHLLERGGDPGHPPSGAGDAPHLQR